MKKLLLAATALAGIASSALAADLPARSPAVAPAPIAVPIFTWTGFYAGLHAGAAWQDRDNCPQLATYTNGVATAVTTFAPNCDNGRRTNFIGGVQIGYNWQINNFVIGAEGDISWLGNRGNEHFEYTVVNNPVIVQPTQPGGGGGGGGGNPNLLVAPSPGANGTVTNVTNVYSWSGRNQTDMIGTVRLRAGVAFNRALLYVTGGLAFRNGGDNDGTISQTTYTNVTTVPPNPNGNPNNQNNTPVTSTTTVTNTSYTRTNDSDNIGWALGGGIEFALAPNVSTKIEYLHVHFDGGNNGLYLPATANGSAFIGGKNDNKIDMVRLGVNWRF
jgi:outer membrane immunogenic protein